MVQSCSSQVLATSAQVAFPWTHRHCRSSIDKDDDECQWRIWGTPKEIIAKLNAAVVDALANDNVRARLGETWPRGARQAARAEKEKWWPSMKEVTTSRSELHREGIDERR